MPASSSLRLILLPLVASAFLFASGCGGGGGGGSDGDDGFPTPRLPAGAARLDGTNANDIATTAVGFVGTLDTLAELKSEESPSLTEVTRQVTDRIMRQRRTSTSVAARTEDISVGLCVSGKATATFEESGSSESGSVTFTACDIGSSIVIDGRFLYEASFNATTLAYSFQAGGELTVAAAGETITIEMNLLESGNDGTGNFSTTVSFSLSGIPGGGFLVTTEQAWAGNVLSAETTDGQLIVYGSDDTRIRITVTAINTASVELDNGSGTFVPLLPPDDTLLL